MSITFKRLTLVCVLITVSTFSISAQQNSGESAAIVVFNDDAPFRAFRPNYRADERSQANPRAWDYLDRDVVATVQTLEKQHGFAAEHVFSSALRGFSARLNARNLRDLQNDPMIAFIEPDGVMSAIAQALPWGIDRIDADASSTSAGNGIGTIPNVNVYVIDTGVDTKHADLNVIQHVNFASGKNSDCNGHGTHVAGTIAARDNNVDVVGVAPGAPITGVKVLGCGGSGTTSAVIKGVDWVTANAVKPAIANMSLGGSASSSLDDAVRNSANSGVFYSIAAGNSGADACAQSPARTGTTDGIMTTAATDSSDQEASWSNFGLCVDVWGPGVSILSTRKGGGVTTSSGTSMAAPHVGGASALYLSSNTSASAAAAELQLKADAAPTTKVSKDGRSIKIIYAGKY